MVESYHFVLKRKFMGYDDVYDAIKRGKKTSEWRDVSDSWIARLTKMNVEEFNRSVRAARQSISLVPKYRRAKFVVGYTKRPMLVADVEQLIYHPNSRQFEVRIKNVKELSK